MKLNDPLELFYFILETNEENDDIDGRPCSKYDAHAACDLVEGGVVWDEVVVEDDGRLKGPVAQEHVDHRGNKIVDIVVLARVDKLHEALGVVRQPNLEKENKMFGKGVILLLLLLLVRGIGAGRSRG